MQPRMKNPASVILDAMAPIQALFAVSENRGVPATTRNLVHLRVSQINGCTVCMDSGTCSATEAGETPERLFAVARWRESSHFSDAERAALALAEGVTRLSDRTDPVPDEIWDEAAHYYDETGLAALLLMIATMNVFNRLNVPTRQVVGTWS